MTLSVPSATTWGSPTATKHALLLHGLTSSSHTWHRVAPMLAAQGYFVTAPNLIGHASRPSLDYKFSSIVQDLLPYLEARTYSIVMGHSVGASIALSLFPHLPASHPTAIVLVDPALQVSPQRLDEIDIEFSNSCVNSKSADAFAAEQPLWKREDAIYRELGPRLSSPAAVHGIMTQNRPWNLFSYLNAVPDKFKVTVVAGDPAVHTACPLKSISAYPHVRGVMVPGAAHWVQYEFPEVIAEEALKTVAGLDAK